VTKWFLIGLVALSCSHSSRSFVETRTNIHFLLIPAGQFQMGSIAADMHRVTISRPFYMGETEVTQAQWARLMGTNPSHFRAAGWNAPVESVTWFEVQEFIRRLNRLGEGHFRLPTEAEWEYACRAGTTTPYAFGTTLTMKQANFDGRDDPAAGENGEYRATTIPVGSFPPNAWGLYDMHGNVWEWCADEVCPYPTADVTDPFQRCGSRFKPIRGGSWYFGADSARSGLRYTHEPQWRGVSIGFRIVRDAS